MARRYHRVLAEKIAAMKRRIELGIATQEERAWIQQMDIPKPSKNPIDRINAGLLQPQVKHPKRSGVAPIQHYRHPNSRRGI